MKQSKQLLLVVLVLITTQLYVSCSKKDLIQPDPISYPQPAKITATQSADTLLYKEIVKMDVIAENATGVTVNDGLTTQEFKVKDGGSSLSFTFVSGQLEKPTTFTFKALNSKGDILATETKKVHVFSKLSSYLERMEWVTMTFYKTWPVGRPNDVTYEHDNDGFKWFMKANNISLIKRPDGADSWGRWSWFSEAENKINYGGSENIWTITTLDPDNKGYEETRTLNGTVSLRHYRSIK